MVINQFTWKIGGPAGAGIKSTGALFAKAMMRLGLNVFTYDEYPSLIRGGHNVFEAAASEEQISAPRRPVQILIALDQQTLDMHREELSAEAAIIYDPAVVSLPEALIPKTICRCRMPLDEIIKKVGGAQVMRNTMALGASFALLGVPLEFLKGMIEDSFDSKDPRILLSNSKVAAEGYEYARREYAHHFGYAVRQRDNAGRVLMTGNEALAWGAIKAGCKFYCGYPMTPSTSLLHTMAAQAERYGIVFKHTEDEISAINTVIGAGYAGVRAMTASAGGGFSLMVEALGMAAMIETPVVMVEAMRPGPSTGLPTWSGQGDLKFVLNASQDEFPRIVLAPGDIPQCFMLIQKAFNLAEKYQTPVVLMTDKHLAECYQTAELSQLKTLPIERGAVWNEEALGKMERYHRYAVTPSGVSPRTLPGTKGGMHLVNSDEHDEQGFTAEGAEERVRMMDKRFRKMESLRPEIEQPRLEGDRHADLTLISWGSTRGSILEAMKQLKKRGVGTNFLQVQFMSPFPTEAVKDVFKKAKKLAIIENNKTGQLAGVLKEQTGLDPHYKILKYDGRPFFPDELVTTIEELL